MAHLLRRAAQRTKELEPNGIDTLTFTLVKSSAIPATEKTAIPKLEIYNVGNPAMAGKVIDYVPVIPRAWTLHCVAKGQIKIDGQSGDWAKDAAKYQLPNWMLGPRGDKETSRISMAYDDDGLYMMFSIAVQGLRDPREVYWPSPKRGEMAVKKPWTWARVLLGD